MGSCVGMSRSPAPAGVRQPDPDPDPESGPGPAEIVAGLSRTFLFGGPVLWPDFFIFIYFLLLLSGTGSSQQDVIRYILIEKIFQGYEVSHNHKSTAAVCFSYFYFIILAGLVVKTQITSNKLPYFLGISTYAYAG